MSAPNETAAVGAAALTSTLTRDHRTAQWLGEQVAAGRRGWPTFPVNAKVPLVADWPTAASTDADQLREWARTLRATGYGIVTGPRSGLLVVDVDPRHGGDDTVVQIERQHGPILTPACLTGGGGLHFFYTYPGGVVVGNRAGLMPGLDVRGAGGFVVGAGSLHSSGRNYEWDCSRHPDDVPLAEAPPWLLELLGTRDDGRPSATPASQWRELVAGVEEGNRNTAVFKLACHLLRRFVDPLVTLELVKAFNTARCRPPLPDDEVSQVIDSAARMELRRRGGAQ